MEIVIDLKYTHISTYEFSTERTVSGRIGIAHPHNYGRGYKSRDTDDATLGVDAHGSVEDSVMVIRPLPGKEEKVERFVAIGRLKNKNFPFCIANSKYYSKIDSE